jgi:acyl-CoA dehydrogenase
MPQALGARFIRGIGMELEKFQLEVREWLQANCPESQHHPTRSSDLVYGGRRCVFPSEDARLWLERMAEKGWTAPTWPREYGGGGLGQEQAAILKKEMKKQGCRVPLTGHGLWMLGPALLEYGSEEQKREHLPRIVRGERRWCQGYSEPGAGSDLASLRCRAEDKGGHFLVNGQKMWTTDGDKSDWIFCLVRTDPNAPKKQAGISFLLIDMDRPGVSVKTIRLINGSEHFCDTFFDNAEVPRENLVGELNGGWAVAKALLVHERTMMSQMQEFIPKLPFGLLEYAGDYAEHTADGKLADATLRDRLAEHLINQQAMGLSHRRAMDEGMAGVIDMRSVSYFKGYATEEDKRGDEIMVALMGSQALGWEGEGFDQVRELDATRHWLLSKVYSIGGGTTEIQWNLVAKQLGLPES